MSRNAVENTGYAVELSLGKNSRRLPGLVKRISPKKVRTKILLFFALLIIAMSAFLATYVPGVLALHLASEARHRVEALSGMFEIGLASGLASGDPAALESGLRKVCDFADEVLYAVLETSGGEVLAAVNLGLANRSGFRQAVSEDSDLDLERTVRLRVPVVHGENETGSLYLGLSFKPLYAPVRGDRRAVLLVSLATFGVGILFVLLISSQITRPLTHLSRTAERISKGDMKQRAKISSRDEIGLLAGSFNDMMDHIEQSFRGMEDRARSIEGSVSSKSIDLQREISERRRVEKELRLAANEIENRVSQRTMELSKVNQELHGKVLETRRVEGQLQSNLDRMEKALTGMSRAMSQTVEIRDLNTAGHHRRVSSLAVAIAKELHLPSDRIEGLRLAGIVHDIGKIAVPLEILAKPARLTKTEIQIVEDHPRVGFEILKSIDFPWPIAHIILQHHERLDGSGYPEGLVGEAILLEARILAVADVVEAFCFQRSYRAALGVEKALEEILKGRGIRYDAGVVDACVKVFREKRFFFEADGESGLSR
jgi:putative nucleotidyltransferase with HDIG domain